MMKSFSNEKLDTDVLIIGGGCAGCWAALRARDFSDNVTLVDKAVVARSGTTLYCHDLLAPLPEEELAAWMTEIVEHTEYLTDEKFVEILLKENGQRIRQLQDWEVPFERDKRGELLRSLGRGHKTSRVILYDGKKLMEALRGEVLRKGIHIVERVMVTDLLTSDGRHPTDGRIIGAVGIHTQSGKFLTFRAKSVVICTGLISAKIHFTYADNLTGDGHAMAFRAGAELSGLEFIFNPKFTAVKKGGSVTGRSLMQFQTLGANIVNSRGERFMDRYVPERKERLSSFGLLAQAVAKEVSEGRGPVYFDMRHFGPEKFEQVRRILPIVMATLDGAHINPRKELVECKLLVSDFGSSGNGGIRIAIDGRSSLPGLLAGGVCAQFPGCAEFLSGGYIAFCNVFGYRAGECAGRLAQEDQEFEISWQQVERLRREAFAPLQRKSGVRPEDIYYRLNKKVVRPEYSVVKSAGRIKEVLEEVRETAREYLPRVFARDIHELIKANEVRNYVHLLEPIYVSALERRESRLNHYRLEYPFRDDADWLKWLVVKKEDEGIKVSSHPVPVESNLVGPPKRSKTPSPIQFS